VNTYYHSHIDPTRKAQEGARGALVVVMDEKKGDFVNPPPPPARMKTEVERREGTGWRF